MNLILGRRQSLQRRSLGKKDPERSYFKYLETIGIRSVRLAINKGNPQSTHFWKKNGYSILREVYKDGGGLLLEAEKTFSDTEDLC